MYHDLLALRHFYQENPLNNCLKNGLFSPANSLHFFSNLAYKSEDIGRCISLLVNVVCLSMLEKYDRPLFSEYRDSLVNGQLISAICNNEAFHHGSNLNAMTSALHYNVDGSSNILINKPMITNAGASDLLFVSVPLADEGENKFAILLFLGDELTQTSLSEKLSGLLSCPTGSVRAEFTNYREARVVGSTRKSLFMMRHMYNMERFLIACIMSGILKKTLAYAFDEMNNDHLAKFANQYLQDKIIRIFDASIKLESLIENCVKCMENNLPVESLLSIIKLSCMDDAREALQAFREICDTYLHPVVKTGCKLASLKNSEIRKFDIHNLDQLESILKENSAIKRKVIFVDGVHSLARYIAPVKEIQYLCRKYESWLFIDDAHGFGIFGENPDAENPWGHGGKGIIKFAGADNCRTFYTSSFGKAFCTHTAFMAIPEEYEKPIAVEADQYIYSAPVSPALIGMAMAALAINETSGEKIRKNLRAKIRYFIKGLTSLGLPYQSVNDHPAIQVICGKVEDIYRWNAILMEQGIFAGIRVFPLTPKNESGFRFAITALNTQEQIDRALEALAFCNKL